ASTGKSTLAVERARRARPSSDENGISSWRTFALEASSAEVAENWIVVSNSARAKRVPRCMVGSESLLQRNNLTGIYVMSAIGPKRTLAFAPHVSAYDPKQTLMRWTIRRHCCFRDFGKGTRLFILVPSDRRWRRDWNETSPP